MKCTHKSYSNKHKPYPHLFLCLFSSLTITSSLLASTRPPHAPATRASIPLAKSTTPATRASIPHRQINNARNAGVHPPRQINNARNAGVHPPSHVINARNAGVHPPRHLWRGGGRKTGGEVKPPKEIGECPVEKKRNFSRLTCASQL